MFIAKRKRFSQKVFILQKKKDFHRRIINNDLCKEHKYTFWRLLEDTSDLDL